jgi:hypothetical protein
MGTETPTRPKARLHPLLRAAGYSLGTAAGGMAFNILFGDYQWRAVQVTLLIVAVAAVAGFLRGHVHPASTLARRAPSVLLTLAGLAALAAFVHGLTVPATVSAAGLVAAAVLVPTDIGIALRLLGGAAGVGFGLGSVGIGVSELRRNDVLFGAAFIGFGVVCIGVGASTLRPSNIPLGAAGIGDGVVTHRRNVPSGVYPIVLGVLEFADGVVSLRRGEVVNNVLFGAGIIGIAIVVIGIGVAVLCHAGMVGRLWSWLVGLTRAPTLLDGPTPPSDSRADSNSGGVPDDGGRLAHPEQD